MTTRHMLIWEGDSDNHDPPRSIARTDPIPSATDDDVPPLLELCEDGSYRVVEEDHDYYLPK